MVDENLDEWESARSRSSIVSSIVPMESDRTEEIPIKSMRIRPSPPEKWSSTTNAVEPVEAKHTGIKNANGVTELEPTEPVSISGSFSSSSSSDSVPTSVPKSTITSTSASPSHQTWSFENVEKILDNKEPWASISQYTAESGLGRKNETEPHSPSAPLSQSETLSKSDSGSESQSKQTIALSGEAASESIHVSTRSTTLWTESADSVDTRKDVDVDASNGTGTVTISPEDKWPSTSGMVQTEEANQSEMIKTYKGTSHASSELMPAAVSVSESAFSFASDSALISTQNSGSVSTSGSASAQILASVSPQSWSDGVFEEKLDLTKQSLSTPHSTGRSVSNKDEASLSSTPSASQPHSIPDVYACGEILDERESERSCTHVECIPVICISEVVLPSGCENPCSISVGQFQLSGLDDGLTVSLNTYANDFYRIMYEFLSLTAHSSKRISGTRIKKSNSYAYLTSMSQFQRGFHETLYNILSVYANLIHSETSTRKRKMMQASLVNAMQVYQQNFNDTMKSFLAVAQLFDRQHSANSKLHPIEVSLIENINSYQKDFHLTMNMFLSLIAQLFEDNTNYDTQLANSISKLRSSCCEMLQTTICDLDEFVRRTAVNNPDLFGASQEILRHKEDIMRGFDQILVNEKTIQPIHGGSLNPGIQTTVDQLC
ncbi:hypothetical protein D915_007920 [Fasciola hepatica]|uniref:Uncharacterized protein n=1 Tax=Fasciola hepatica TaxID=6192 RepID=A0A4E0R787_FASHE|nr:hypothetical protein D915_007920 [Fasciola hepatica]